jgi:hypothetical protein
LDFAVADHCVEEDRVGEYEMKLMDIDQEHLGIPDTQYDATITMSSSEFQRICRDLAALGESVKIEASKEGVRFSSEGEVGSGSVLLKQSAGTERGGGSSKNVKRDPDEEEEEEEEEEDRKPDVEEEGGEHGVRAMTPPWQGLECLADDESQRTRWTTRTDRRSARPPTARPR